MLLQRVLPQRGATTWCHNELPQPAATTVLLTRCCNVLLLCSLDGGRCCLDRHLGMHILLQPHLGSPAPDKGCRSDKENRNCQSKSNAHQHLLSPSTRAGGALFSTSR